MKYYQYNPFTGEVILVDNVFCPTGQGGGIDPTCSPDKGGGFGGGKSLTKKEEDVLTEWGIETKKVNASAVRDYLTTGKGTRGTKDVVDSLKSASSKLPVYKGEVYRGITFDKRSQRVLFTAKIGRTKEYEEKSFSSASSDRQVGEDFASGKFGVVLKIKSKTARDISPYMVATDQKEVLIQPNTKYKLVKTERIGKDTPLLHLEEI